MPFSYRFSYWGIVSLLLLLGEVAFGERNLYLHDRGRELLLSWRVANQLCVLLQLGALVCGVVAMARGSKWWVLTVVPAALIAMSCFFGEV